MERSSGSTGPPAQGSPHGALHKLGSGKAVEGVTSGSRRGPQEVARYWGRGRGAGTRLPLGGRVGGARRRCEAGPAPSPRGICAAAEAVSARACGGGWRAGFRRWDRRGLVAQARTPRQAGWGWVSPLRPWEGRAGRRRGAWGRAAAGPDQLGRGWFCAGPTCGRGPWGLRPSSFLLRTLYF